MSEYENHKSPLGYRNQILAPSSYGPVPRKVGIIRDKPTVNYKQRVSFNSYRVSDEQNTRFASS